MITPGFQEWQGHDGTGLDLSSFVALKNLTASALCFVPPLGREYARDGLYKILPKSLEMIHVSLPMASTLRIEVKVNNHLLA